MFAIWRLLQASGFSWTLFLATFSKLHWGWLMLATLCAVATYFGRALRWAVLIRPLRAHPSIWNLFKATVIGFSALVILGRPGEFVRPCLIARKEGVPIASQLAAWVLERVYDLLIALIIFGFALRQVRDSAVSAGPALSWVLEVGGTVVLVACAGCLLILLAIGRFMPPLRRLLMSSLGFLRRHHLSRVEQMAGAFMQGAESAKSIGAVFQLIAYTVLEWILIAGCYVCIMRAFQGIRPFSLLDVVILMGFVAFGSLVQLPGVGGGVQVVTVLVLRELFGVSLEEATGVALAIWIITFVVILPLGLPLALHEGLNWEKLKNLGEEVQTT